MATPGTMTNPEQYQTQFIHFREELKSYIYRIVINRQDTEDIAQETYIRGFRNLHSFKGNSSFKTWVFSIATNMAKNNLKAKERWGIYWTLIAKDPDGNLFEFGGIDVLEVNNQGTISEIEGYWIADPTIPVAEEVITAGQEYFTSLNFTDPNIFDIAQWIATMDENVVVNDAYGSPERVGHEAQRLFSQGLLGSGMQLSWEGIDVLEVNEEGKISRVFGYWDESVFGS